MNSKSFNFRVLTPERLFFEGEANNLFIDTLEGEVEILCGHVASVFALKPSIFRFSSEETEYECVNSNGFVKVEGNSVLMMVETAEWPHEIEETRVRKTIERDNELIRMQKSYHEYLLGKASLARAFARLKQSSKKH